MSAFKMSGVVKLVKPTQVVSDKFSKREFVVTDMSDQKYPQDIMFELTQDKVSLLDSIMEGQEVEVSFNLRGREWISPSGEAKYFNTLTAFRIEGIGAAPSPSVSSPSVVENNDLPF